MSWWVQAGITLVWVIAFFVGVYLSRQIIDFIIFRIVAGMGKKLAMLTDSNKFVKSSVKVNLLSDMFNKITIILLFVVCLYKIAAVWMGSDIILTLSAAGGAGLIVIIGMVYANSENFQCALQFYASQPIDEGDYLLFKGAHWEEQFVKAHSLYRLEFMTKHGTRHFMSMSEFINCQFEAIPDTHDRVVSIPLFPNINLDLIDNIMLDSLKDGDSNLLFGVMSGASIRTELEPKLGIIIKHLFFGINGTAIHIHNSKMSKKQFENEAIHPVRHGWKLESIVTEKILKLMSNNGVTLGTPTGIWRDTQMPISTDYEQISLAQNEIKEPVITKIDSNAKKTMVEKTKEKVSGAIAKVKDKVDHIDLNTKRTDKEIENVDNGPVDNFTEDVELKDNFTPVEEQVSEQTVDGGDADGSN